MSTQRWDPFDGTIDMPQPSSGHLEYVTSPQRGRFSSTIVMGFAIAALMLAASYISEKTAAGSDASVAYLLGMSLIVAIALFAANRKGRETVKNFRRMLSPESVMRSIAIERQWGMRPGFDPMRIARLSRYAPEISSRVKIGDMTAAERRLFGAELWGADSQGEPFWAVVSGYKSQPVMTIVTVVRLSGKIGRRIVVKPQHSKPFDDIELDSVEFNDLYIVREMGKTGEDGSALILNDRLQDVFRALSPAVIQKLIDLAKGSATIMIVDGQLMTLSMRLAYSDSPSEAGRQLQASIDSGARLAALLS